MTTYYLLIGTAEEPPEGMVPNAPGIPVGVCPCGALVVDSHRDAHMKVHQVSGVTFSAVVDPL